MRKSARLIKKLVALFLVVLMSINTFGAVVSDNDGSAFITKAEFDSLKNDFQSQIDQYNSSIDAKIDGAIAAYLAGIRVATDPSNYFDIIKANLNEVRFLNSIKTTQSSINTKRNVNVYRHYYQKRYDGISYVNTAYIDFDMKQTSVDAYCYTWIVALVRSGTENSFSDQNAGSYIVDINAGTWNQSATNGWKNKTWMKMNMNKTWTVFGTQSLTASKNVYGTKTSNVSSNGSGQLYRYKITPNGRKVITSYCSTYYPVSDINIYAHSYKNYATNFRNNYISTSTSTSKLQYDNTTLTKSFASSDLLNFGSLGSGTPFAEDYNSTTAETRWNASNYLVTVTDNINYETRIWGKVPTSSINCISESALLTADSQLTIAASSTQSTIPADDYTYASGLRSTDVLLSGVKIDMYPPKQSTESKSLSLFCNDYISTIVGEEVFHGQGIKIGEIPQEGNVKVTMTFRNAGGENANARFILTNGKVGATGTSILNDWESVTCNGTTTITRTISVDKKSELWINCYSDIDGVDLILDNVELALA